uniref:Tripartite motif containing 35-12 n=1 Tax=Anabas testudineus TaxID=64144 RepID=A0A3Q1JCI0_ANATE
MASRSEKDLSCPYCHDIFKDPVLLSCSHSLCKSCLRTWWRKKQTRQCPVCKRVSSMKHPPCNLVLKNLCEAFTLERDQRAPPGSKDLCSLHSEKLKLFCLDHQEPACVVCRDSEKHIDHKFRPIDEVAEHHREQLQKSLQPLQEKLKLFEQAMGNWDQTSEHIKVQVQHTKKQIKKQFKKLHRFLEKEEEARIAALRSEEKHKQKAVKEDELRAEDVLFLQNYQSAVERVQQRPQLGDPDLLSGPLIDVAKHVGNLSFSIWKEMKEVVSYSPVILDPNTANPGLTVSEVRRGKTQNLLSGLSGFDSGIHGWDVDVGDGAQWTLGVALESVQRKGHLDLRPGFWFCLGLYKGEYKAFSPSDPVSVVPVRKTLRRIRVCLDCQGGRLSFYDPDAHVHTFSGSFTRKLFLFLGTKDEAPIKILPNIISIRNTNTHNNDLRLLCHFLFIILNLIS